jgi:putative DNA primase/helicase
LTVDIDLSASLDPVRDELHRSHLRMAERLAESYQHQLRYAHGLGWLVWDGTRWARDRDGAPMRAAVETVKAAIHEIEDRLDGDLEKDVRKVETANALGGILRIASCLHPLAIPAERLDTDPYLFNVTNGTLDLRTGELRNHDPGDLITKIAGCEYDPGAAGRTFDAFIKEVLPQEDIRGFVQRVMGQSLVGKVEEHVLPIFTGVGGNGKTTLVELLLKVFGDYGIMADPELLVEHSYSQHPTGQADLLGVRFAVTVETDEGRRLAAATVKRLTGGDKIRARRMRQDFFEFDPSHTVTMVTNHKPRVSGDDPALWRRIRIVPFDVVIDEPDTALPDRLALEQPAALSWMVAGYQEYVQRGLAAPAAVAKRTNEYRIASDAVGRFLDERTISSRHAYVRARELFTDWCSWCHRTGEEQGSEVAFSEAMARRGIESKKRNVGMVYLGVGLAATEGEA